MGKKENISIEQLRSSYAIKVAKKQIEAFKELDKQIKKMFDETIKSIAFRDMLLEQIAKWDRENPNEPMQFRFEIRGTVSPKNHS